MTFHPFPAPERYASGLYDFITTNVREAEGTFLGMLQRMGLASDRKFVARPGFVTYVGQMVEDEEGKVWRVERIYDESTDDWFALPSPRMQIHRPWDDTPRKSTKIEWLEDVMFPNLTNGWR